MARFWVSTCRVSCRRLLSTSSGKPNNQPPHEPMDFMRAAEILFSEAPRQKKFRLDFHLWQFFVACLPPLAVYLTALYARHEMKRIEEIKAAEKRAKAATAEESNSESFPKLPPAPVPDSEPSVDKAGGNQLKGETATTKELQTLKERLDAMEHKIREMELTKAKNLETPTDAQTRKSTAEKHQSSAKAPDLDSKSNVSHKEKKEDEKNVERPDASRHEGNPEKK